MPRPIKYNKSKFLTESVALFIRHGYSGTSVGDILDETGMNRHSLYKNFGDKDGLYLAALEFYRDQMFDDLYTLFEQNEGFSTLVEAFDVILDSDEAVRCLMAKTVADHDALDPQFTKISDLHFERIRSAFVENFTTAKVAEPELAAEILLTFFHGLPAATTTRSNLRLKVAAKELLKLFEDSGS